MGTSWKDSPKKPGAKDGKIGLSNIDIIIDHKKCIILFFQFLQM